MTEREPSPVEEVDALGLLCPLPVLRAERAAARMRAGQALVVLADDPAAREDLAAWCAGRGHDLVEIQEEPREGARPVLRVRIQLGSARPRD